ncbi:uncharacterized protein C8Q71DRAFT_313262 [Rhodofomes roseus]|uniref:Uncharacterized protein n=1 Tax=Rhodofomes roseus TaxID=34475 RepID=A0ABQ8K2C5_9APHY|nr:uncharacterized protein C8Q71DRAFT_313262 [Rhodofomes roseus]KAH9830887.1 hypothetical protein C8Q71DRAFT_313262 [Rhodofomes roseus]
MGDASDARCGLQTGDGRPLTRGEVMTSTRTSSHSCSLLLILGSSSPLSGSLGPSDAPGSRCLLRIPREARCLKIQEDGAPVGHAKVGRVTQERTICALGSTPDVRGGMQPTDPSVKLIAHDTFRAAWYFTNLDQARSPPNVSVFSWSFRGTSGIPPTRRRATLHCGRTSDAVLFSLLSVFMISSSIWCREMGPTNRNDCMKHMLDRTRPPNSSFRYSFFTRVPLPDL